MYSDLACTTVQKILFIIATLHLWNEKKNYSSSVLKRNGKRKSNFIFIMKYKRKTTSYTYIQSLCVCLNTIQNLFKFSRSTR
ncbi:hypothetical protein KUTeg_016830 [Tegillarca granosa]|uniref:Uncharacterized protein n=1 Tax=Tegillarca granosa TaxID=220873 RepID=A0ABQ9ESB6_TEGGR|nr:hypothetical protein KUTeg_016830 [Tegillarca granosa]